MARLTPDSTFSLPIPIMYISMFELAMRHNAEGLFLFGLSLLFWYKLGQTGSCLTESFARTMTSLVNLHSELSLSSYYMGSANVSNDVMWVRDSRGHVVVEKALKKEFVGVVDNSKQAQH